MPLVKMHADDVLRGRLVLNGRSGLVESHFPEVWTSVLGRYLKFTIKSPYYLTTRPIASYYSGLALSIHTCKLTKPQEWVHTLGRRRTRAALLARNENLEGGKAAPDGTMTCFRAMRYPYFSLYHSRLLERFLEPSSRHTFWARLGGELQ